MRFNTAYNHKMRLLSHIKQNYSMAKLCFWTHEKLLEEIGKVWKELQDKKIPSWVHLYLSGYNQCLRDSLWNEFEFVYLYKGELYSTDRSTEHKKTEWFYERDLGHLLSKCPSAHVWKGTDKPFTNFSVVGE